MKIIINDANKEKIDAAIKTAEGRASARTITADCILRSVQKITSRLSIPKKAMVGITATIDINAQDFPNAYKYTPESTIITVEYTRSGWTLTDIYRDRTRRASRAVVMFLPEQAKEAILASASVMATWEV